MLRLPRQALRLHQCTPVQRRGLGTTCSVASQAARQKRARPQHIIVPEVAAIPELDPSFAALLRDMDVGGGRRRRVLGGGVPPAEPEGPEEPAPESTFDADAEAEAEVDAEDGEGRRPERRAPATIFGVKHIGQVVLPDALVEGVTAAIQSSESPKAVRAAYLELLAPAPKHKVRGGINNTQSHALARAAAFFPGQYAAVYNVLKELRTRLGGIVGPVLDISFSHGAGFWATHEVFGPEATEGYTLVHRTRHGLDLAREFAAALPVDTGAWVRDYTLVEMEQPQIAMSTFELSALPTIGSRRAHLDKLISSGAEHIVIVDRATDDAWGGVKYAREYLLSQSNAQTAWSITAPCPHENSCPRAHGKEACAFAQQLQRPPFLRKTKHQKRGEEITPYTYLVMSRGARPEPIRTDQGRTGGVGYDAAVREHEKLQGKSVLREVEGGDIQQFESIPIETERPEVPRETNTPELDATLRNEAYTWPRLIAPPMKRKGRVIMDACMPEGGIDRFIVSKSQGKQVYHDARKTMWGDLFAHEITSKRQPRTRGVRVLSDPALPEVGAKKASGSSVKAPTPQKVQAQDEADGEEVDALLKKLGLTMPTAVMDEVIAGEAEEEVVHTVDASKGEGVVQGVLDTLQDAVAPEAAGAAVPRSNTNGAAVGVPPKARGYATVARPRVGGVGLGLRVSSRSFSTSRSVLSAQPAGPASKINVQKLQALHDAGTPITVLTAYDYPTSLLCSNAGVDVILVGDSLAQVALGYATTVPLTLDEMSHHVRAVARGCGSSFLLADLPFGYMEESVAAGAKAAMRLIKDGADGIKIEGGREIIPLVKRLAEHGVPIMPHIGLQPQRANTTGYRAQARSAAAAVDLIETAKEMEAAGAFALLLEAIPHQVGTAIASRVSIPTIGIGAGPDTSGQVLVITDMLGYYDFQGEEGKPKAAKFVREFGNVGRELRSAVDGYCAAVRDRSYPERPKETYTMPKEEAAEFRRLLGEEKE